MNGERVNHPGLPIAAANVARMNVERDELPARVSVRVQPSDEWTSVTVPADVLGSYDAESDAIASALPDGLPFRSPVIVEFDPWGRYETGCATLSHYSEGETTDRHADCEHEYFNQPIPEETLERHRMAARIAGADPVKTVDHPAYRATLRALLRKTTIAE